LVTGEVPPVVGLAGYSPCFVSGDADGFAPFVGDGDKAFFSVVAVGYGRAVGVDPLGQFADAGVFKACLVAKFVMVAGEVAFRAVGNIDFFYARTYSSSRKSKAAQMFFIIRSLFLISTFREDT
jgi:hypothetical protein